MDAGLHWTDGRQKMLLMKTLSMTYGHLQDEANTKKEIVDLCTLPNHGLLANEWMGAGVLGESPADMRVDDGMAWYLIRIY